MYSSEQALYHAYSPPKLLPANRQVDTMVFRAIAEGNWKRSLDFGLHSTHEGELQVPFPRHVRPAHPTTTLEASFEQYTKLPAELQLQVLQFCDAATLFQLMHTSRSTRAEARKLFFSDPGTWYIMEADWLLRGGYTGHTMHDVDFIACVERLNVDFGWMSAWTWMSDEASRDWEVEEEEAVATGYGGMDEKIQRFWQTVAHRLPKLKHIILSDDQDRYEEENPWNSRLPPAIFRRVARLCPSSISASVYLFEGRGSVYQRMERKLWRIRSSNKEATPTNALQEWTQSTDHPGMPVIPPYRPFRGLLGAHEESYIKLTNAVAQRKAIQVLRIAALERHHFYNSHTPFECPDRICFKWFENPEEYTSHAIWNKHARTAELPAPLEAAFTENDARLDHLFDEAREMERPFLEWWGKAGSEERKVAEKEVIRQLECDPLYAQDRPVMEHPCLHALWRSIDGDG